MNGNCRTACIRRLISPEGFMLKERDTQHTNPTGYACVTLNRANALQTICASSSIWYFLPEQVSHREILRCNIRDAAVNLLSIISTSG